MKRIFTCLFLFSAIHNLYAQTPNWLWAKSSNGGNYEDGGGLGYDGAGNFYMSGRFGGTVNIGGVVASAPGQTSVYNAKFDKDGNFSWIVPEVYNGGNNYCMGFALDKNKNSYNSGSIESPSNLIFTKYNTSGVIKWDIQIANSVFGGPGNPTGLGMAIDDTGNVYMVGELNGSINFGSVTLNSAGSSDIFVAKFDSNGTNIWAISAGDANFDEANSIKLDKDGNIYICGSYTGTPAFGSFTAPTAVGGSDFFIAKLTNLGIVQWMATATSTGMLNGAWWPIQSMAIDSCNNLYVTGSFESTAQFGSLQVTSQGSDDIFVAKCMNDGQWAWVKSAGGSGSDRGEAITLDKDFDVYILGDYSSTAQFGGQSVTSSGAQDICVAKYANSTGDLQWVQTAGSASNDGATGIAVDEQKFTYITGTFNGTANFGTNAINATAANVFFVAKLDTVSNLQIAVTPDPSYCPGSTVTLPFIAMGPFDSNNNIFTAQLSDSTGNFISSQNIGTINGSSGGNIPIQIPSGTPSGSNYSIRVISSAPAYSSYDYCFRVKIGGGFSISISPSDTSVCSGSQVRFNAGSANTYAWSSTGSLSCTNCQNPIVTAGNTADTLTLNATSLAGCSAMVQAILQIGGSADGGSVSAVRDTICQNTPGNLTLSGSSNSNIQWQSSIDDINFTDVTGDTLVNYKTNPLTQTTWYRAMVGSGICSAISDTQQLFVPPALVAYFSSSQTAANQLTFNSDSSLGKIRSFHWDFGDNSTSDDSNPSHTFAKDTTYYVCLTLYDGSNCSYTFCRYSDVADAVQTIAVKDNWIIYPNPFNSQLTISMKQPTNHIESIEMYDVLGRSVINKNTEDDPKGGKNSNLHLDVSSLAKGMYYVMIRAGDMDYIRKVVKQ